MFLGNGKIQQIDTLISILAYSYGAFFVVVGIDKYLNILTFWQKYYSIVFLHIMPFSAQTIVILTGIIEVIIGCLVLTTRWRKEGVYLMLAWFGLVALDLLSIGHIYLDTLARDLLIAVGAYVLGCLLNIRQEL